MSRSIALMIVLIAPAWVGGCPVDYDPTGREIPFFVPRYEVTVSIHGSGTVDPAGGLWAEGSTATYTATPAVGWSFERWGGDVYGAARTIDILVDSDLTVTAVFVPLYDLSVSVDGEGEVVPNGGTYKAGTPVTLTAVPADGWRFDRWEGDVTDSDATIIVLMDSDLSISAVFVQLHEITVSVSGEGVVYLDTGVVESGGRLRLDVDTGSTVSLTAWPADDWRFHHWEGGVSGTDPDIEVTVEGDLTIVAVFVETHELIVSIEGRGTVDPSGGIFDAGTTVRLAPTPEEGWLFGSWDGDASGTDPQVTVLMDGDKSVTAKFVSVGGYRCVGVDGRYGYITIAVAGTEIRGIERSGARVSPFRMGYEIRGTVVNRELTLTRISDVVDPATITVTVDSEGAWAGLINGAGFDNGPVTYEDAPVTADPASLTGFEHPAAGYRTIQVGGEPGKMILAIDGDRINGNAILGEFVGACVYGSAVDQHLEFTLSFAPQVNRATVVATVQPDGSLVGTIDGSGFENDEFFGDRVTFP